MKKILIQIILVVLFMIATPFVLSADDASIDLTGQINRNTMSVDVVISDNPGISIATFEIDYDNSIMVLKNLEYGDAFSSLDPIMTGTETELGFGYYPFRINYYGDNNDTTTGKLFTLTFEFLKDTSEQDVMVSIHNFDDDAMNIKYEPVSISVNPLILHYEGYKTYTFLYLGLALIVLIAVIFIIYRKHGKKN